MEDKPSNNVLNSNVDKSDSEVSRKAETEKDLVRKLLANHPK